MRIDHYFKFYGLSRRDFFKALTSKQVSVNGHVIDDISTEIKPNYDAVFLEGERIYPSLHMVVYMFHKPKDVLVTLDDPKQRRTLVPYLSKVKEPVFPIGRLDRNTTGLLLLTNDGSLAEKVMHPRYKLSKTYRVSLDRDISKKDVLRLCAGILLDDGPVQFVSVLEQGCDVEVVVQEGRNRLIRRVFDLLGYDVLKLKRTHIGPIKLGGVSVGSIQRLTRTQLNQLQNCFNL